MILPMNPQQFLKSVYLGDRACKTVMIDSWRKRVAIQVDVISRLKPGTETWDYYTDADIKDGWLVFTEVGSVRFEPAGPLPNDLINDVSVKLVELPGAEPACLFEISIGSVDDRGNSTEVHVRIEAGGVHLEDPAKPGMEITS
jgi:hypothetical protein